MHKKYITNIVTLKDNTQWFCKHKSLSLQVDTTFAWSERAVMSWSSLNHPLHQLEIFFLVDLGTSNRTYWATMWSIHISHSGYISILWDTWSDAVLSEIQYFISVIFSCMRKLEEICSVLFLVNLWMLVFQKGDCSKDNCRLLTLSWLLGLSPSHSIWPIYSPPRPPRLTFALLR